MNRTGRWPFEGGNGMGHICSISYALYIHETIITQTDLCCAISCSCYNLYRDKTVPGFNAWCSTELFSVTAVECDFSSHILLRAQKGKVVPSGYVKDVYQVVLRL